MDVHFVMLKRRLNAQARYDVVFGVSAHLVRKALHDIEQNAGFGLVVGDLYHRHGPALVYRKAQRCLPRLAGLHE